jgi:hypothetical protein
MVGALSLGQQSALSSISTSGSLSVQPTNREKDINKAVKTRA